MVLLTWSLLAVDDIRPEDELPNDDMVEVDNNDILGNGGGDMKLVASSFVLQSSS